MGYRIIFALCVFVLICNLFGELALYAFKRLIVGLEHHFTTERQQDDW